MQRLRSDPDDVAAFEQAKLINPKLTWNQFNSDDFVAEMTRYQQLHGFKAPSRPSSWLKSKGGRKRRRKSSSRKKSRKRHRRTTRKKSSAKKSRRRH